MRILVAVALVVGLAGGAVAQTGYEYLGANMGLFFVPDVLDSTSTNTVATGSTIDMYLYLLNPPADGSRGFEGKIRGADGIVFGTNAYLLSINFDPTVGALNVGTMENFLVGYAWTQPNTQGYLLLCRWQVMFLAGGSIELGPAVPSSVANAGMAYLETDPTVLRKAGWASGIDPVEENPPQLPFFTMATVAGDGVVRTEEQSLSQVKALFR